MTKTFIFAATVIMMALQSCQKETGDNQANVANTAAEANVMPANITTYNISLDGMAFTHALNGADTCISIKEGKIEFSCTEKRDIFCDPNGKLTNNNIPILLSEIDNTKPFTFTAKVTPGFTDEGLYNAADLFVFANDTLWQKLCFEQDERGRHRIVTVRTQGTSDDNNHEALDGKSVYLRISSDTRTIASFYSLDKKEWQMVRLYKNYYPAQIWVGIASQSPTSGICTSVFEDVLLLHTSVSDFRTGE